MQTRASPSPYKARLCPDMTCPADITAIILSYNEEIHIARCIERVRDHVSRIVVVDSGSTDETVTIAKAMGAEVLCNTFVNQAQQFNWALDNLAVSTEWILRLDCDEYLDEPALAFLRTLGSVRGDIAGVEFRLKVIFKGHFLRFGGYYSTDLVRLWRRGRGRIESRWMDERTLVDGEIIRSRGHIVDENLNSIGWWTDKHNRYASRHALEMLILRHHVDQHAHDGMRLLARRARMKRFLRDRVYRRFPPLLRPTLYWLYRYVFLLGFLDGRMGLVWHFLHGFWYYLLIDVKLAEAEKVLAEKGNEGLVEFFRSAHALSIDKVGDPA